MSWVYFLVLEQKGFLLGEFMGVFNRFLWTFLIAVMGSLSVAQAESDPEGCTPSRVLDERPVNFNSSGQVVCVGKTCYYTPLMMSASDHNREHFKALTGTGLRFIPRSDGFIERGRDANEVSFWHKCQEVLDRMIALAPEVDNAVLSTGRRAIHLQIKIYHVTTQAFSGFSFGLSGLFRGEVDGRPPRGSLGSGPSGFDLNFAFGNLTNHLLQLSLSRSRNSKSGYELRDVSFEVLEGEIFERSLIQKNYRDTSFSNPATEDTGYRFKGQAFVEETSDEPTVVLKDLHLTYSVPQNENPNVIAEVLSIHRLEVEVPNGRPYVLASENLSLSSAGRNRSLPFFLENSNIKTDSKLVVFVTAWPKDSPPKSDIEYKRLSKDEVEDLPVNTSLDLLETARFDLVPSQGVTDFDLIQLSLDKKGLTQDNYNEILMVSLSADGVDSAPIAVEAQNLVAGHLQIPSPLGVSAQGVANLQLELNWVNRDHVPRGNQRVYYYELTHYQDLRRVDVKGTSRRPNNRRR